MSEALQFPIQQDEQTAQQDTPQQTAQQDEQKQVVEVLLTAEEKAALEGAMDEEQVMAVLMNGRQYLFNKSDAQTGLENAIHALDKMEALTTVLGHCRDAQLLKNAVVGCPLDAEVVKATRKQVRMALNTLNVLRSV